MFETLKSGGIIMIPIILCGLFATYIIVERCIYFVITKKRDSILLKNVLSFLNNDDYESCVRLCREVETPTANVILKAIFGFGYAETAEKGNAKLLPDNAQCIGKLDLAERKTAYYRNGGLAARVTARTHYHGDKGV